MFPFVAIACFFYYCLIESLFFDHSCCFDLQIVIRDANSFLINNVFLSETGTHYFDKIVLKRLFQLAFPVEEVTTAVFLVGRNNV